MPVRILFIAALFCWSHSAAQPQLTPNPVMAEPIGVKQGLSQGMVNCIYQDKEGYIWVGTKDGLNRYDGYNITTYRNNPNDPYSLPDNYCNKMLEDDNGNYWVGTNTRGLCLFDKATERFYPATFFNSNNENKCIRNMQYAKGQLYVETWTNALIYDISRVDLKKDGAAACTKARLLCSYNQWQTNPRFLMGSISNSYYLSLWIPGQSLWVSFIDSIFQLRPNADFSAWSLIAYTPQYFGLEVNRLPPPHFFPIPNDTGKMVICTDDWVYCYDLAFKKIYYRIRLPKTKFPVSPGYQQTNDGSINIVGDTTTLIFHPQTKYLEWMSTKQFSKVGHSFSKLLDDKNGLQWFGSPGFGMAKVDTRKQGFKSYSTTYNAEVFSRMPSDIMPPIPQQWKKTYECRTITAYALDKKGVYWAYLTKPEYTDEFTHLNSYDTKSGVIRKHPGLKDNVTFPSAVYNDRQDRLWIFAQSQNKSNRNRIARMDKATGSAVAEYNLPDDIKSPSNFVSQFYLDERGLMWLATINGLYQLNEKTGAWKHWKNIPGNNNSLSADILLSICPDPVRPEQYLWIGTEGAGFNRFEKATGNCIYFDEKDGLPNNVAYCILSDSLNNLWISTNKGLSCFNPVQKTFRNFTDEDGLPGNEFNRHSAMYMPNGNLMFGGVDGFVIFNPREVLQKDPPAPVVFTGLTIANKPVNWKQDSTVLQQPIGYAKTITLQPGQNIFTISFASLEFRDNRKKLYKFRLKGFDKDWSIPTNRNEATYTNLSPGTYTFFVKGANTDGVWNEKPISINLVVLPYWHQTWWFRALIAVLFAGVLYGFYRYRLRQGLKMLTLREQIAHDLHDEIGSTLSSISLSSAVIQKKTKDQSTEVKDLLQQISINTDNMMESMSDIIWAVNTRNDNMESLVNRMRAFAIEILEPQNCLIKFDADEAILQKTLNMTQRKNIYLLFKEAINNVAKYANCANVWVHIAMEGKKMKMAIKDDGKGFDASPNGIIQKKAEFGGNGLRAMQKRAEEMKGTVSIDSAPLKGTTVNLIIPL